MAFEVRLDSLVMRGHAEAMTEDGGVTELQRALLT
jgi:hypothetical protein